MRDVQGPACGKDQEFRRRRDDDIIIPVKIGIPAFNVAQMIRPEILQSVFHGRDFFKHAEQNLLCFGLACQAEFVKTIRAGKAQNINGQERLLFNIEQDKISGAVPTVDGVVEIEYVHCGRDADQNSPVQITAAGPVINT